MRTLLVGAGAIGGTVAVLATHAGYKIDILCKDDEIKNDLMTNGFKLNGVKGEYCVKMPAFSGVEELTGKYDIVIIATKYQLMPIMANKILPFLNDDSVVLGMQNGICTEELASIVGKTRAVGCMIGFGATRNAENDVTMTSLGEFYVGMFDGSHPVKLDYIKELLNTVLPTKISENVIREQYSKLIINSCINATAAITGKTLGVILDDKRARNLFLEIAREGMYVAKAMNISVPKYGVMLDYRLLMLANNKFYNSICKMVVMIVGKSKYKSVKPSTLQSLENGEKTEIDIFNGYIAKKGEQYNVSTPVNSKLVKMIKQIEAGERKIDIENLAEFDSILK